MHSGQEQPAGYGGRPDESWCRLGAGHLLLEWLLETAPLPLPEPVRTCASRDGLMEKPLPPPPHRSLPPAALGQRDGELGALASFYLQDRREFGCRGSAGPICYVFPLLWGVAHPGFVEALELGESRLLS